MNQSRIEWTERTWNPITGCTKHSEGCQNCYAEKMAKRLKAMNNPRYKNEFAVTIHSDLICNPLHLKKPSVIFVCSMSDLFHEDVDFNTIDKVFKVMEEANQHIFQVLTKRPERMVEYCKGKRIPDNIWLGTSVELEKYQYRIDLLNKIDVKIRFLSCEPLLGSLNNNDFDGISWIVVGGESGANSRPVDIEWIREIRDKCQALKIPFFFKQWGGWNKKKNGHILDGKEYKEMPKM
ncbi:MAG: phage Gp37/Gp68 family protein [Coprobacillus sp.]